MNTQPWSFEQAAQACRDASQQQRTVEKQLADAYAKAAAAEQAYRCALAQEIVRQHAEEGVAWTVAPDLARGNTVVAQARYVRDVAEGVREAVSQAAWRAAADRKDAARFSDWSQRAAFRDEPDPGQVFAPAIGARR